MWPPADLNFSQRLSHRSISARTQWYLVSFLQSDKYNWRDLPLFVIVSIFFPKNVPLVCPNTSVLVAAETEDFAQKKTWLVGNHVENIPHIFYLYMFPVSHLIFSIHWWVWMITSFSFFPVLVSRRSITHSESQALRSPSSVQKSPFSLSPTSYRPSATGFWASVRYLHHAVQSRPIGHLQLASELPSGIFIMLCRVGQALSFSSQWPVNNLGCLCFVWHTWIPSFKVPQRPVRNILPAATMFEWPWIYAWR